MHHAPAPTCYISYSSKEKTQSPLPRAAHYDRGSWSSPTGKRVFARHRTNCSAARPEAQVTRARAHDYAQMPAMTKSRAAASRPRGTCGECGRQRWRGGGLRQGMHVVRVVSKLNQNTEMNHMSESTGCRVLRTEFGHVVCMHAWRGLRQGMHARCPDLNP